MNIPEEFKYLATCFFSRSDQEHETTQDWVQATVRNFLTAAQRSIVKRFSDGPLSGPRTDSDLERPWRGVDSDYRFKDGAAVRRFLAIIQDASG